MNQCTSHRNSSLTSWAISSELVQAECSLPIEDYLPGVVSTPVLDNNNIMKTGPLFPAGSPSSAIFPQAQHFLPSIQDNLSTVFDPSIPPALTVQQGDLVHVETIDCFSNLITPENPDIQLERSQLNPITGPIYIQDAEPGDILAVQLHDIRPKGVGVACCGTTSGQLCHTVKKRATMFFDLTEIKNSSNDETDNTGTSHLQVVTMRNAPGTTSTERISAISFPASPMLGVIGVAPKGESPISTMPAGTHGGNLDNKLNGIGATIYIPVNHPGGLLSIGDMHASQGDGEISGTGVEIGGDVLLSCRVLKQSAVYPNNGQTIDQICCQFPVTETATHFVTHGVVVEDIPKTTTVACEEAARLLVGQWGFTPEEAFIFLSVQGDLGLCQSCHPDKGTQIARMMVPKIDACPRPFKCLL